MMSRLAALVLALAVSSPAQAGWLDGIFDGAASNASPEAPAAAPETGKTSAKGDRVWVVLPAAGRDERTAIAGDGVSIEEVGPGTVAGVADFDTLERLRRRGIVPLSQQNLEKAHPSAFPTPDSAYHDFAEVGAALARVASANPDLASVFSIGSSVQGRDLLAIRFNIDAKGDEPSSKPGVVFLGTHHAREHLSTEMPVRLAQWLAANRGRDDVKKLLASRDVYFIPLVNPDGAEYDHSDCRPDGAPAARAPRADAEAARGTALSEARGCSYKYHRKNMKRNSDGSTGVDLNRNYGYQWGGGGASASPGSDTYRGPAAFSEPETQAVKRFVEERPNLKVLLSYHTFSELILYPWGHKYDPIEDGRALAAYEAMARKMAGWTGYTPQQSSDLYIASGDTTDWAWGVKKIFAFTFELTPKSMWSGGFYPGAGVIEPTFQKNLQPMLYLLEVADDPYRAADGQAGAPRGRRGWGGSK